VSVDPMPDVEPSEPRPPFQFSLATLLFAALVLSVLASALAGMLNRHLGRSPMPPGFFVLMAVAAPVAILILVGLWRAATKMFRRRGP
jgi:hypothetical protein